jgi:hypothetical protein
MEYLGLGTFVQLIMSCLCLKELSSFMKYVYKLATSAAEITYLGGTEHVHCSM